MQLKGLMQLIYLLKDSSPSFNFLISLAENSHFLLQLAFIIYSPIIVLNRWLKTILGDGSLVTYHAGPHTV